MRRIWKELLVRVANATVYYRGAGPVRGLRSCRDKKVTKETLPRGRRPVTRFVTGNLETSIALMGPPTARPCADGGRRDPCPAP